MIRHRRWRALVVAPVVVALVAAGCSTGPGAPRATASEPPVTSSPSPASPADATRYALPDSLCDAVDLAPLKDLYPAEEPTEQHLLNSPQSCSTAAIAPGKVIGVLVTASVLDDDLMENPGLARDLYEMERSARGEVQDIAGVGTAAFWYGGEHHLELTTYDGNITVTTKVHVVNSTHDLASDMPERLAAITAETLNRLRT